MSVLIDGHIHIHPSVDRDALLDSAWENFSKIQQSLFAGDDHCACVLLLAEGKENNVFAELHQRAQSPDAGTENTWLFVPTAELNSVIAQSGRKKIILIAGRQLISSEKLELLSLFCPVIFPDNSFSLAELAGQVTEKGGIPLVAWGVGKWLGARGRVVEDFIARPPVPLFMVGDNGNRPNFWPYPKLLALAEKQGISSLAGSDPLPLPAHGQRAGSYGGALAGVVLEEEHPAEQLQQVLASGIQVLPFGRGANVVQFFRDQLQVNLQKRLGKGGR